MRIRVKPVVVTILVAGVISLSAGCSQPLCRGGEAFGPCYPPPPPQARVQYLRSFTGGSDFRESGGGFWHYLFGGPAESRGDLVKPYGLAAADGRLFVCDTAQGGVFVFDFAAGTFEHGMGPMTPCPRRWRFASPTVVGSRSATWVVGRW